MYPALKSVKLLSRTGALVRTVRVHSGADAGGRGRTRDGAQVRFCRCRQRRQVSRMAGKCVTVKQAHRKPPRLSVGVGVRPSVLSDGYNDDDDELRLVPTADDELRKGQQRISVEHARRGS